jgi:DNA polymerase-3 subunit beta
MSRSVARYNLNGVFFEPAAGAVRMVATDGHRLSLAEAKVDSARPT